MSCRIMNIYQYYSFTEKLFNSVIFIKLVMFMRCVSVLSVAMSVCICVCARVTMCFCELFFLSIPLFFTLRVWLCLYEYDFVILVNNFCNALLSTS